MKIVFDSSSACRDERIVAAHIAIVSKNVYNENEGTPNEYDTMKTGTVSYYDIKTGVSRPVRMFIETIRSLYTKKVDMAYAVPELFDMYVRTHELIDEFISVCRVCSDVTCSDRNMLISPNDIIAALYCMSLCCDMHEYLSKSNKCFVTIITFCVTNDEIGKTTVRDAMFVDDTKIDIMRMIGAEKKIGGYAGILGCNMNAFCDWCLALCE